MSKAISDILINVDGPSDYNHRGREAINLATAMARVGVELSFKVEEI